MEFILVVVRPFGRYAAGDRITDPDGIRAVLEGEQAGCVVRVLVRGG